MWQRVEWESKPPPIGNLSFEIKLKLIAIVQGNKFYELPMEDPYGHRDQYDRLCSTVKSDGISEDAIKLRFFPFP